MVKHSTTITITTITMTSITAIAVGDVVGVIYIVAEERADQREDIRRTVVR